ncbi:cobalamin biosynthesis protein, partial [Ralstonia pseudosolanacearum]
DGIDETRPPLGIGRPARAADIRRALALVSRTLGLWLAVLAAGGALAFAGLARQGL